MCYKLLIFIYLLSGSLQASCRTSSNMELVREFKSYQDLSHQGNFLKLFPLKENTSCKASLQNLQKESLQKVESLSQDKEFQEIVAELQSNVPSSSNTTSISSTSPLSNLYIFVSFSLSEKALLNLAQDAKRFGATLVLRGFRDGSYRKTAQSLQEIITKTGHGVLIDPELYSLFGITAVPTYVLAKPFQLHSQERTQTPLHDKLQGHVSVQYALETFEKEGDLKQEAQHLLEKKATP